MRNRWVLIGVNTYTCKRDLIATFATYEAAVMRRLDLKIEKPLRFAGVTIEYGNEADYV